MLFADPRRIIIVFDAVMKFATSDKFVCYSNVTIIRIFECENWYTIEDGSIEPLYVNVKSILSFVSIGTE